MNLKYLLFSFICLFISIRTIGQTCNCTDEFLYVKDQITHNYAGFKDKVTTVTNVTYTTYTQRILKETKGITSPHHCALLINDWLNFFKDRHIYFGGNPLSTVALQKIVSETENIKFTKQQLDKLKHAKGIDGIYWSNDSAYRIAIIKSANNFRDYAGVITYSKIASWKEGQVKLELRKSNKENELIGIMYAADHTPYGEIFAVTTNTLGTWQREGTVRNSGEALSTESVAGRLLSEKTFYIKIRSFDQSNAANIDSLFKTHKAVLDKIPNLIIDLRDNGGGSDFAYEPITPYLYTDTIKKIGADVLATERNIEGWKPLLKMDDILAEQKKQIAGMIESMERGKGGFVSLDEDEKQVLDSIRPYPQKIAILVNKGCGSTTEEFLLEAMQSKKVTVMGEATAGVLDYANMREVALPCMPYTLYYATTRSRRIDMGKGIDNVGLQPAIKLNSSQNWIVEAQQYLEKK
ncbi:peptidase S41-like protein [Chitinophaga niastensis]|uniref:Peptidase S41-like protein n=1 Tax=Chitinophaga niastensis TaxID=536980 RepID=A0A2P8HTB9_CHINA|nr:S41 family peptidase [Chitinophaga niastensis]PSL49463.1 peptidase S41-like protein [Chitinophaga niastensis]